jgi:hypothetical protein
MTLNRRQFVTAVIASSAAAAAPTRSIDPKFPSFLAPTSLANLPHAKVDFRYAPRLLISRFLPQSPSEPERKKH